jgi:MoaA/NifB/PqqE/SkfB family radical SAM enzyme
VIILWRITERCNYACSFCAFDRRLDGARKDMNVKTVQRFGKLLGEYIEAKGEKVLLSWLGGEPLLWAPIFEISEQLHHEYGINISVTTNGSTLHIPNTIALILKSFSELTISVDGFAEFHNQLRGCPGGWERLRLSTRRLATERNAIAASLKLRANIVLMRDNIAQFPKLCEELVGWHVDEITFNQLGGRDRPEFFPEHALRPDDVRQLRKLLPALRESLALQNVKLCGSETYLQRIEASAYQRSIPVTDCSPGEGFLFIDEVGRIAPCSFTNAEYGIHLDSIVNVNDILNLSSQFRSARKALPVKVCNDCSSNHMYAKFTV